MLEVALANDAGVAMRAAAGVARLESIQAQRAQAASREVVRAALPAPPVPMTMASQTANAYSTLTLPFMLACGMHRYVNRPASVKV